MNAKTDGKWVENFRYFASQKSFSVHFWGQKSRLARLARLGIFLHGWRLTLRVKFRGWRGAAG
jgi:hypothetical protein